jgi:hypothetical protein
MLNRLSYGSVTSSVWIAVIKKFVEVLITQLDGFIKPNQFVISNVYCSFTIAPNLSNHELIRLRRFVSQNNHNLCN